MIVRFLRSNFYVCVLAFIVGVLALVNYEPGTFLTGWDTLHPEFDFGLNFQRLINGVWRSEQGLGAVAGHSHMADLPRVFILWILHFFLPLNALRYSYFFISLLAGPLGMYYLVRHITHNIEHKNKNASGFIPHVSFLGALFYLFNLATVQVFYAPFEMFATQYAALPWIILFSCQFLTFLTGPVRMWLKSLVFFVFITILATPQAYAAHLWYSFFAVYVLFLFLYGATGDAAGRAPDTRADRGSEAHGEHWREGKPRLLLLLLITLAVNSFWLLPNIYFVVTSKNVPSESKQNRIFSQEYQLRNREHGYLKDTALNKGFYFSWSVYDFEKQRFDYLMPQWRNHINRPAIAGIGYFLFAVSALGIFLALKNKEKVFLSFLPFVAVSFIFLMNHTPPFEQIFNQFAKIPIFEETLRFVFTKFSILFQFGLVLYFSYAIYVFFTRVNFKKTQAFIIVSCFFLIFITYMSPMFRGDLISNKFKVKIPDQYFEFWRYMRGQKDGVVLSLPLHTFSGWQYYDWSYQGAGFVWFGLKQSILDRDFDRWDKANEKAFREFQYAFYSQDVPLVQSALKKYNIRYIVWDKSSITPSEKNRKQILFQREIESTLTFLLHKNQLRYLNTFGTLRLFELTDVWAKSYIAKNLPNISPQYDWGFEDKAFEQNGPYVTFDAPALSYPFRTFLKLTDRIQTDILGFDKIFQTYFIKTKETLQNNAKLHIPNVIEEEDIVWADIYLQKKPPRSYELVFSFLLPKGLVDDAIVKTPIEKRPDSVNLSLNEIKFPIDSELLPEDAKLYLGQGFIYTKRQNYLNGKPIDVNLQEKRTVTVKSEQFFGKFPLSKIEYSAADIYKQDFNNRKVTFKNNALVFNSKNYQSGIFLSMENLPHESGYVLAVRSRNLKGLPLRVCLKNFYSNICALYDELSRSDSVTDDYFIIPPFEGGIGYGLAVDNISYGNYETENELYSVSLLPFPYRFLSSIYYEPQNLQSVPNVLVENSSFNKDRRAYIGGKELTHLTVNNWANGWSFDSAQDKQKVVFIFWPQYLEYFGFILLAVALFFILRRSKNQ